MGKVCIGLPVFNGGNSLAHAIESLLGQTYSDFELIISDNASTDDTAAICERFATQDKRIKYIRQPGNIGAFGNFKFVLEQAGSDYFMWAAADDAWEAEFIEQLLASMEQHPDAVVSFSNLLLIDSAGNPLVEFPFDWLHRESQSQQISTYVATDPIMGACNLVYGLYRREALLEATNQFFWKEGHLSSDFSFILYILFRGRFVHIPSVLFKKRVAGDSWTMRSQLTFREKFSNVKLMYQDAWRVIKNSDAPGIMRKPGFGILLYYGFAKFLGLRFLPAMKWNKVHRLSEYLASECRRDAR